MDRDALFIRTVDDLKSRVQSYDEYDIIHIPLCVRRLLTDDYPLVDQVNRERRKQIFFTIVRPNIPTFPREPIFWSIENGLDPDSYLPDVRETEVLKKDQFLAVVVMLSRGNKISIKDILDYYGFVCGGIHAGSPKKTHEKAIQELVESVHIGGLPAGNRMVQIIGRVLISAIDPLYRLILSGA